MQENAVVELFIFEKLNRRLMTSLGSVIVERQNFDNT